MEKGEQPGKTEDGGDEGSGETKTPIPRDPSFSGWRHEVQNKPRLSSIDGDDGGGSAADFEDFELPLLQRDGSGIGVREPKLGPRQRSYRSGENASAGRRFAPFNLENSLRTSDSIAKLELLDQSALSSISAVMVLKTLFYIAVWYTFSTCLTLYNKSLLGDKLGKFPAPLLMNTFHFGLQAILSKVIICFNKGHSDSNTGMTWRDYFFRVLPMALGTALDVDLSNASLVFISVTFATMCKSASPIFLLLFAFAFRLESPSIKLLGIMSIISVGVLLTVAKETEFQLWGFLFVMLAAVMSGFRWSMTQILLQCWYSTCITSLIYLFLPLLILMVTIFQCGLKFVMKKEAYGFKDPFTLMSCVSPIMAVVTALLSLVMDPWHEFHKNSYFDSSWHIAQSCLLMLIGGLLAFLMVLTEYILISATSAVTVSIAGVVKEAITILVAVFYFHDQFTLLKGIGLLTIMIGVSLFNWYRYEKLKKGHLLEDGELRTCTEGETRYTIGDDIGYEEDEA